MTDKEMSKVFSEAMEEGGNLPVGKLAKKRENACSAARKYVDEVERTSFAWGYKYCLKRHGLKQ